MILTPESVLAVLVHVLESATGLGSGKVILEGGNQGPRPASDSQDSLYCSLWWKRMEPLPQNTGDYADNTDPCDYDNAGPITQHLRNETWCTVQVSFRGASAFSKAVEAAAALQNDERFFDLWKILGYGGIESIQDATAPFRGGVQPHAFFNLSFYACFGSEHQAEWFRNSQWAILGYPEGQSIPGVDSFDYAKENAEPEQDCRCIE